MKNSGKSLICLLCVMVLSRSVWAATSDSPAPDSSAPPVIDAKASDDSGRPYSAIWMRNVFDLKPTPPPPPPKDTESSNAPPPGIKLVGLAKQGDDRLAILVVTKQPEAGKQGASTDQTFIMSEGNRRDAVEMLAIDLAGKKVKINLEGEVKELNLETNRATGGGPPQGQGGRMAAGRPGAPPIPNAGGVPVNSGGVPAPGRPLRQGGYNNNNGAYSPQSGNFQPGAYSGATTIGSSLGGSTPGLAIPGSAFNQSPSTTPTGAAEESVPPEVTAAILAAQKAVADQNNRPFPPLPPGLDVSGGADGSGSSAPAPPAAPTTTPSLPPTLQPVVHGNFPGH